MAQTETEVIVKGLSAEEAKRRMERDGFNELPSARRRSFVVTALNVAREPMFLLLIAAGMIYLLLGDRTEAFVLLGSVFVIIGITLYQERKTERALDALRDLSSPRALVIRDGERQRIAGREVVRGDVLVLAEGDRVPADAKVLKCLNLSADESLLTGEAVPVRKVAWTRTDERAIDQPGGDDLPFVYSGTLIVQGQGFAEAEATGIHTEIGKIGKALQTVEPETTPLQRETGRVVRNLAIAGVVLCALLVVAYGLLRHDWLHAFLAGITLAMGILPEEFPVVLTIFLALGAWRIARRNVLTRRVPVIETLGSATVLCVDKTGTLTQNRMAVRQLFASGALVDVGTGAWQTLPAAFHHLVDLSVLASQTTPFDPMEKALRQLGEDYLGESQRALDEQRLIREYPLSPDLLAMSRVWHGAHAGKYTVAAKGAPEAVFDLCHLDDREQADLSNSVAQMAARGLRVLAVAEARIDFGELPESQRDIAFTLVGLVGLEDPVRPAVPDAVRECYAAGIRVVMITGDYPVTAQAIAEQIGLRPRDTWITGPELDAMDDAELRRRVSTVNIFARVVPAQKLRLVNALKADGEIVAMTGDGVNDAPALKAANIGIAMGGRGTDVARESAALVLLDDDFTSIVQAVRQGRRIFDNLRKAMAYIFAIHVPIAGMSLIPVLLNWPLVLLPVHIVFMELIIDPACSVVFEAEPEEATVMTRPPRNSREPLFDRRTVVLSVLQGVSVLAMVLAAFGLGQWLGQGAAESRAFAFTTLIVANLGLIFTNRSWTRLIVSTVRDPNAALWWVVAGAVVVLGLVLYVPGLRDLFQFAPLSLSDLAICLGVGLGSIVWFEGLKGLSGHQRQTQPGTP